MQQYTLTIQPCVKYCRWNRPWTNRITSASTTIVSNSSQSHMVDPDWIHILGKQYLPCVKGKVTVYVTCLCSETRCFWRVIYHHISGSVLCSLLHSFNCLVYTLFRSKYTYHVSGLHRKIVLAVITHF